MPAHVLHVSRVGFLGGAERVLLTLTQGIVQKGHRVTVACPAEGGLLQAAKDRGAQPLACGFNRMRATANPFALLGYLTAWLRYARVLLDYCRREQVRLLHAHHPAGVLYCLLAARRLHLPVLLHVHEMLPAKPLYRLTLRIAARYVSQFICVSSAARELLDSVGIDDRRVTTIPNGVDWHFLDEGPATSEVRRAGLQLGVFGVIEPRKGQDVFLAAAARVLTKFPDAHFWIVGALALKDKSDFAERLTRQASAEPLAGHVTFAGHRTDVSAWMRAMDIVVLPSVAHESMGMVLVEAMTLGRPTVCSRIGVTDQIVQQGKTGFVVPAGDVQALADAMESALRADRKSMGQLAAADMRLRFSPSSFCRKVLDVYHRLIAH